MNLEEFIRESLVQIARGVHSACSDAEEVGAKINPGRSTIAGPHATTKHGQFVPLQLVEFDVAVVASSGAESGGKAGITVASLIGLGVEGKSNTTNQSESRIKFSVPIALPDSHGNE